MKRWAVLHGKPVGASYPMSVDVTDPYGLPSSVTVPSPLTVVSGLNGSGKSRLLRALAEATGGRVVALHQLLSYLQRDFAIRDDISELLEENGAQEITGLVLQAVSDLVRRDYDKVLWYNVEIVDSPFKDIIGDDVVPGFAVEFQGEAYDFRTMGLGELSAHVLMWLLYYRRGKDAQVMLLDEPEAFLPPPSRDVVLSYLLEAAIAGQPLVVASHSLELIQPAVAAQAAVLLNRSGDGVEVINAAEDVQERVAGLFGTTVSPQLLLVCEDESAYLLTDELLRRLSPRLSSTARFLWLTGFGNLKAVWSNMPRPSRLPDGVLPFAFVADGDKASEVVQLVADHASAVANRQGSRPRWPIVALPGDPDVLMKEAADRDVQALAKALGLNAAFLAGRLEQRRGREAHNWVEDLIADSNADRQPTLRALAGMAADLVMADEERREQARASFEQVAAVADFAMPQVLGPPSSQPGYFHV